MVIVKNKKKTLVCVIGETRAQDLTWNNFNKYLLKSLNADLALCVAEKNIKNNKMYNKAKYIWKYKDSKDYTNHFDHAQKTLLKKRKIKKKPNWKKMLKVKDFWLARVKGSSKIRSGTGGLLIYNRWFLLQNLIELNLLKKYDRFIITRSDFYWCLHHPKLDNLNSKYIWIPNGEKYGGYTDRHAVLSKENVYDYLNLIEPILLEPEKLFNLMKSKKNWNLERYIKFHLNRFGYRKKVNFFPYIMFTVRNSKIKTTFRPGTYSYKHKFFIKYFKEYLSSIIIYNIVGDKNKNYSNYRFLYIVYKLYKNLFKFKFFLMFFLKKRKIDEKFDKKFVIHNLKKKLYV